MNDLEDLIKEISVELEASFEHISKIKHRPKPLDEESHLVINLLQYFQISLYDLVILIESMKDTSGWKYKLYARQLYLTTYETIDDLQELLGKKFRDAVIAINLDESALDVFNEIGKKLNLVKRKYRHSLHNVRHYITAHRDHDAEKQIEYINSIFSSEVVNLQVDLLSWCLDFLTSINTLMPNIVPRIKNA